MHLASRLDQRAHRVGGIERDDLRRAARQHLRQPGDARKVLRQRLGITRRDVTDPLTLRETLGQEIPNSDPEVLGILICPKYVIM
jgi:hypothetical protein